MLRQLAERVPLSFWSEFYDCPPEKAASKLAKNPPFQKLFDLSKPILNFSDPGWAYHTLKENADEKMADALMGVIAFLPTGGNSFSVRERRAIFRIAGSTKTASDGE